MARITRFAGLGVLAVAAGLSAAAYGVAAGPPAEIPTTGHFLRLPVSGSASHSASKSGAAPTRAVLSILPRTPAGAAATSSRRTPPPAPIAGHGKLHGDVLSAHRFGPITFGMTVGQAEQAAGVSIAQQFYSGPGCELGTSAALPGVTFDISPAADTILAAGVDAPAGDVKTLAGIGLGATPAMLRAAYGSSLRITSYFYDGNGTTDVPTHEVAEYSVEAGGGYGIAFVMTYRADRVGTIVAGGGADGVEFC